MNEIGILCDKILAIRRRLSHGAGNGAKTMQRGFESNFSTILNKKNNYTHSCQRSNNTANCLFKKKIIITLASFSKKKKRSFINSQTKVID